MNMPRFNDDSENDDPIVYFDPDTHASESLSVPVFVSDDASRSHYVDVGRSRLRDRVGVNVDEGVYGGRVVGRREVYGGEEKRDDEESLQEDDEDSLQDDDKSQSSQDDQEESSQDDQDESQEKEDDHDRRQETIMTELARIEQDQKSMMHSLTQSAQTDLQKGRHVQTQLNLWDTLLDVRIRTQKIVDAVNQMPQPDTYSDIIGDMKNGGVDPVDEASSMLTSLLGDLVDIRIDLVNKNHTVKMYDIDTITTSRKRQRDDIDSLRDDPDAWIDSTWTTVIDPLDRSFDPYRDTTIDKWSNKIQASTAGAVTQQKKFKSLNQSVVTQIRNVLQDHDRLVKRTQLRRSDYTVIGQKDRIPNTSQTDNTNHEEEEEDKDYRDKHLDNHDPEIFDDHDHYHHLLKDLIESRLTQTTDPILLALRHTQLKQLQTKQKRRVDTKASKGRKIRYGVHEKLMNFMAGEPRGEWHDEMVDELFMGLFGKRCHENGVEAIDVTVGDDEISVPDDGFKIMA